MRSGDRVLVLQELKDENKNKNQFIAKVGDITLTMDKLDSRSPYFVQSHYLFTASNDNKREEFYLKAEMGNRFINIIKNNELAELLRLLKADMGISAQRMADFIERVPLTPYPAQGLRRLA